MICQTCASIAGLVSAAAFVGFAFGLAYFAALRRTVSLIAARGGWLRPSALTLGRLVAIAILLMFAARLGTAPLLAAFMGFLAARAAALRFVRGGP